MVLKGRVRFDRQNLPPYIFTFNVAMVAFFIGWFVVSLPPIIALGCIYGEAPVTYIVMGCLFGAFFLGLLILYTVALKLRDRLVTESAAAFKQRFSDMPLEEAESILKEKDIITDKGYIGDSDGVFGKSVIPFDKAGIGVCISEAAPLKVEFGVYIFLCEDGEIYRETEFNLNTAMYNFLKKKGLNECVTASPETLFLLSDDTGDLKNIFNLVFGFRLKKYRKEQESD